MALASDNPDIVEAAGEIRRLTTALVSSRPVPYTGAGQEIVKAGQVSVPLTYAHHSATARTFCKSGFSRFTPRLFSQLLFSQTCSA